ncbi:MAG: hypothetical protein C4325_08120 [Blastocatellia bacterium]
MEMNIVCKECSSGISASDAFCPYCGIKIELLPAEKPDAEHSVSEFEQTIIGYSLVEFETRPTSSEQKGTSEAIAIESGPLSITSQTLPTVDDLGVSIEVGSENILPDAKPVEMGLKTGAEDESKGGETPAEIVPTSGSSQEITDHASQLSHKAPAAAEVDAEQIDEIPQLIAKPPRPTVLSGEFVTGLADAKSELAKHQVSATDESEQAMPKTVNDVASPNFGRPSTVETPISFPAEQKSEQPPSSIAKPAEELPDPYQAASIFDSVRIMEGEEFNFLSDADQIATMIPGVSAPIADSDRVRERPRAEGGTNSVSNASIDTGGSGAKRVGKLKPLPEGTLLNNRYEIIRKIGGGGMGAVYLASDNNLGGVLRAVKEMVQSHIEEDQQEKAVNDFKRESMILSTLDHPSIPTIYDYFFDADEGRFYLVMKYISGGDLASKLRSALEGRIDELTVTEWAIQITDVLNYLHNQPTTIVYRDLKPSNIMLDGNTGRIMLIDFGIARSITQKEEKGVTAVGTMGYAPPELFSGNVEPRSDIYSLGSTMFHLLTGADPQSNPLLIFDFQKNPRPRQINPRLSDQIERILMRAVEYNAESRFSSAAEMKAVLEEHLANLRSGNVTYGTGETPIAVSLANQLVFCGFCGQRIVATDLFCAFCGAKQPIAQKGVHREIYQQPSVTARLVVEGTSDLSTPVFVLQKEENLIGRRDPVSNIFPEVDLSKYDPQTKISRRHARIWRNGTDFMLEDLGSSNGTSIETGKASVFRLQPRQPYKLTAGDRIRIGDALLHFIVG